MTRSENIAQGVSLPNESLSIEQVNYYRENGFLHIPSMFSEQEVLLLRDQTLNEYTKRGDKVVLETGTSNVVRSVYAPHIENPFFNRLLHLSRLVAPAKQLLQDDVYLHQYKINTKHPFCGELWEWHQDFRFWKMEDGVPKNNLVNMFIYLNDTDEFNGAPIFIPGSHQVDIVDTEEDDVMSTCFGAKLKYRLRNETVAAAAQAAADGKGNFPRGLKLGVGRPGDVFLMHPSCIHCSPPNLSPHRRDVIIISYNALSNKPVRSGTRPSFVAADTYDVVKPLFASIA
ncbi:hypothetical protein DFJ77DRAFT_467080 [Powellomyces hirtus]|nr:hypothetical protein DFJ77DRAFT_467080 [Powellomyces hirtus]